MAGRRTAGGLVCSHGSDLDTRIPRAKIPSSALPPEVRAKMGLKPRKPRRRSKGAADPYAAGAGVLKPRSSEDGNYAAGCQKNFLRRGSGHCFGSQYAPKTRRRSYSKPTQAVAETGYAPKHAQRKQMQSQRSKPKQKQRKQQRETQHQSYKQQLQQRLRRQEQRPQQIYGSKSRDRRME